MTDERRIAACLQACQSLSTEALEAFNAAKATQTEPRQVVYVLNMSHPHENYVEVFSNRAAAIAAAGLVGHEHWTVERQEVQS